jgi:hypothetical protein
VKPVYHRYAARRQILKASGRAIKQYSSEEYWNHPTRKKPNRNNLKHKKKQQQKRQQNQQHF